MADLPRRLEQLDVARFSNWLAERGADVLASTNPYEVLRFRANDTVSIIYRNKNDELRCCNGAGEALGAFVDGTISWRGRPKRKRQSVRTQSLVERDGEGCFYCGEAMSAETRTIEHLVPITHGGPNGLHNCVLAHRECNTLAGNMSVARKVAFRDRLRGHTDPEQGA